MVTGPSVQNSMLCPDCPKGPSAEAEVRVLPNVAPFDKSRLEPTHKGDDKYSCRAELQHTPVAVKQAVRWEAGAPFVLYLAARKDVPLFDFVQSAIKPSLPKSDQSSIPIIYWKYNALAELVKGSIGIRADEHCLDLHVDTNWNIIGEASAGVRILCVIVEVIGGEVTGIVRPFTIGLKAHIASGQLMLYSEVKSSNIWLWMLGSFPLGMVAHLIFGSLIDRLIREKIVELLNSLRITLLDLGPLFGATTPGLAAVQSMKAGSTLIGIKVRPSPNDAGQGQSHRG